MFGAGSDTTASAISISIMAAACYPEAQAKVQEELDNVIGKERGEDFLLFILSLRNYES
jgi:cytochrome P450